MRMSGQLGQNQLFVDVLALGDDRHFKIMAMELPDEKYSYEVRRIVAEEAPRASFDEVVELIRKQIACRAPNAGFAGRADEGCSG